MSDPVDRSSGGERSTALPLPAAAEQGRPSADTPIVERPDRPRHLVAVPDGAADAEARDRHPSAGVDRHLDTYFAAVVAELEARGVVAGPPQRSDSLTHMVGSIAVDCTAVRSGVGEPVPVILAWDEDHGWVVGLHADAVDSSCRIVDPSPLPSAIDVAEFVVGLARTHPLGDDVPGRATVPGPARLRLVGDR